MKRAILCLVSLLLAVNLHVSAQRGHVVETIPMATLNPQEIMANLQLSMDELTYGLVDLFTYKQYSVQAVKVIYVTIDAKGLPTYASGVVFLPVVAQITSFPVMTYMHGTLTRDTDVPSYLAGAESIIGWIMAMDGYIAVLPDYVGLGDGPGVHPYYVASSEAAAAVDMIKASGELCSSSLVLAKPDGRIYMSGYSQGAHVALATQREVENNPLPGANLQVVVAGSGAYSLSYVQKKFVFNDPDYPSPSFLPYLLLGFQDAYGNLYTDLDQVFVSPYNTTIPGLFDGWLTVDEIDSQLPVLWKTMFVPKYLSDIQYKYFHPVNAALRKNDLISWKPKTRLSLYYCTCDELAANENSLLAYLSFILRGSDKVTCLPVGPFAHRECAPFVLLLSKIQFDCSSGANPCGINISSLISRFKSTSDEKLAAFAEALDSEKTIDINEVYANQVIAEYLRENAIKAGPLLIYPNPARDLALIEIPSDIPAGSTVCLYDMQGKLIRQETVKDQLYTLDIRSLQAGVYKVVLTGERVYTGTVVKIE